MKDQVIAALFYLRGEHHDELAKLAPLTGVTDLLDRRLRNPDPTEEDLAGHWGGFYVEFEFCQLPNHGCLEVVFSQNAFYRRLVADESDAPNEPARSLLDDFRVACEQLRPEVAVILSTPAELMQHWIRDIHKRVAGGDPNQLLGEGYKLFFVNNQLSATLRIPPGRDTSRISEGTMVFLGTGADRWG